MGNGNEFLCLHFGVKVLLIYIIVKKSLGYIILDNLHLVKVSTAISKSVILLTPSLS